MAYTATRTWKAGSSSIKADWNALISANMDVANQQELRFTVTVLNTGLAAARWIAPYAVKVNGAHVGAGTASTTGSIVFDILKIPAGGSTAVTLFTSSSEFPTLTSGSNDTTSFNAPDVTAVSSGDVLTVNCVAAGSTNATADVSLVISLSGA